ncbi:(Fe-S)-binding protein [Nakamurella antarctica]|uniref:(Fe-S)-binding protein n=1 Tax=Nakamurella antarctica TaxID=1902245 RepID=A0A3G8ZPC1_9ACTN|nr:(Fe-S)-binding protein [Nakamurella antarctica]AZI59120.1 (Fe-S)-binding protein [Nakamurella antarctica]
MTVLSYAAGLIASAFILVGFGMLIRAGFKIAAIVKLGQPDETRNGAFWPRFKNMGTEVLGHTRMLKWGIVGVAHWFVMVGFGALFLTLVEAVGETWNPKFEIPLLGHWALYGLFVELIGLTTLLGIGYLIFVRQRNHPRVAERKSRFLGSNFAQAYFVEFIVASIGVCIFLIRGFKAANGYFDYPTWATPISTGLGKILPAWPAAISVVALIKVILSMMWAIVIAQNLTMGIAWHRFTAFFNIYFKREESGAVALGALKPMMSNGAVLDFEKADPEVDVFGAGKIEDFSWKGWLDFTTCTECGRCQSQCPAWNTAKALSPKMVMLQLRDHAFAKAPYLAAGGGMDMAGNEKATDAQLAHLDPLQLAEARRPLVGTAEQDGVIDPAVLWDCTTCGACVEQCPVDIEHVDHIVDMRRYQVLIESEFPSELGGLFRNLENKGNPWGQNNKDRMGWAADLEFDVPVITDVMNDDTEYLFWVGCAGAFEDRAKKTTRAIAELLNIAGVTFAVLGTGETCTGDSARRAGNEFLFQMLASQNVETINAAFGSREQKKIVVSCAHCFNTLLNEYPALGGEYEVVHHTQLLNKLVRDKRLVPLKRPSAPTALTTYHDPCYLGRHNKVYEPPRELIEATGATFQEMPRNQSRSMCCGAGGARMWMEEKIGKRINVERVDEAISTGATAVATSCPFCSIMLNDGMTARLADGSATAGTEVKDVALMLLASVKG